MVLISTTVDGADHADEVEPRLSWCCPRGETKRL
jgi:hypothetical protein